MVAILEMTEDVNCYSDLPYALQDVLQEVNLPGERPRLAMPENVLLEQFSQAFAQIANHFGVPACWMIFKQVPGQGVALINGGDKGALNLLSQLIGRQMGTGKLLGSPQCVCVGCGTEIPPGKSGRLCHTCMAVKKRSRIILP